MNQPCKILLLFLSLTMLLTGCKKNSDFLSYDTKISFNYNGQQYNRTSPSSILTDILLVQGNLLFVNFTGLAIEDQDNLLNGKTLLLARTPGPVQCAYLQPTGTSVSALGGNCSQLQNVGNPIDSVQVYWYESGSINFSYNDCKAITTANVAGQYDCAITGTFDMTLTNKNNQKIILTNGTFSGRIKKFQ
ncbi:MAG: hypothetical protein WAU29_06115 [Chitinophagaceae bacterium]